MKAINQDHDDSCNLRGVRNQNQEDVEMDGQDENEAYENNANGGKENLHSRSNRK